MAASEQLKTLVAQMPDPDDRNMFTKNIDKERIEGAIAQIEEGGRESVRGLVDLLDTPGSAADVKPHYALHCLGNRALLTRNEKARREFCQTMAGELGSNRSTYVKSFLCQELQWAGRKEATPALGKLLSHEELSAPAAMALVAIGEGAAEQFRAAWPNAKGKCRLNILHGLAATGDRESADLLRKAMGDEDAEIRLTAGWGLARLGDAEAGGLLIQAADASAGWARIKATQHCLVLAENLAAAGRKKEAAQIYQHLVNTRTDPTEAYIREAATRGLKQAAGKEVS
jgi:hypothetical protein